MYTNMRDGPPPSAEWVAYSFLRTEILTGRLTGGTPIQQQGVATRLGISRIPVRDALRHLIAEGLVSAESNRRVVVTKLGDKDLFELFAMRAVLEGLAARHAMSALTKTDFERLKWLAARMDETETASDVWVPMHREFHELICRRSGMPRLVREIDRLRRSVEPYVRVLIALHGAAELRVSRHRTLVTKLRDANADRAEELCRAHVLAASQQIMRTIRASRSGTVLDPQGRSQIRKDSTFALRLPGMVTPVKKAMSLRRIPADLRVTRESG